MIKTIAVDDEPLGLKLLEGYIRKTPFLQFCGVFDSPLGADEYLRNNSVDLIFLDIQMPDMTGTDFARGLPEKTRIIFTTAHEKYALEGFRLQAVDYLLKPIGYDEFLSSANKAKKLFELETRPVVILESNEQFLFLKSEYKIRRINFNDILYIEGMRDYIKVYLRNETKPVLSINSLKSIEIKLPELKFMRVHRSFIVNLERVETIERNRILFGKVVIPISDAYREKFQKFVDENFL